MGYDTNPCENASGSRSRRVRRAARSKETAAVQSPPLKKPPGCSQFCASNVPRNGRQADRHFDAGAFRKSERMRVRSRAERRPKKEGTPDSLWKQGGKRKPISELIFRAGSETSFQQIFQAHDRPASPRLSRLIPLERRRLKRLRLGLRPQSQPGGEVAGFQLAPYQPHATWNPPPSPPGKQRHGKGEALEGVSVGCPLSRRGKSQTGLLLALTRREGRAT